MANRPKPWTRREFLAAGGAAAVTAAARGQSPPLLPLVPKVNGGINVQPLRRFGPEAPGAQPLIVPELIDLQLRAAYELGFDGLRTTVPFVDPGNLLAAIPYVRAARAVGIDVLCILSDFAGFAMARALHDPRRRPLLLQAYRELFARPVAPALSATPRVGRIAFQVLNEPVHSVGLPPEVYVGELLRPVFDELKRADPELIVVAAAEVGNVDGPGRMRAMLQAGLEFGCDRIAYHVYSRKVIPLLSDHVRKLVWITESGASGTANHLPWVREVFPEILAGIKDASRIFYFDLFDPQPGGFRLIDIVPDGAGYRAVPESLALLEHFLARVRTAQAGQPVAAWRDLVPDVTAYFATSDDLLIVDRLGRL